MRLPLRLRVTLAFAAGMAVLLAALGAFVYVRVASDLTNGIELDLRSRAQVLLGAERSRDPSLVRSSHGSLIDPDEHCDENRWREVGRFLSDSIVCQLPPDLSGRKLAEIRFSATIKGADRRLRLTLIRHPVAGERP